MIGTIFKARELIYYRTLAALKVQHTRRSLGYLWLLLEPLLNTGIYFVIFSLILHTKTEDFIVFLLIGTTAWSHFEGSVMAATQSIQSKASLLRQIYVPKFIFPITAVLSLSIKYVIMATIVLILSFVMGHRPNAWFLFLPVNILAQFLLGLGLGMPLAICTVYFRDLDTVLRSLLKALMFLSGIFYSIDRIPEQFRPLFYANPMAGVIENYRRILMGTGAPDLGHTFYAMGLGLVLFVLGYWLLKKMDRKISKQLGP